MCTTLFLIGRSGCGKSTAIRQIEQQTAQGCYRTSGYPILAKLCALDTRNRFRILPSHSFEVLDERVYTEVLEVFAQEILRLQRELPAHAILCVEVSPIDTPDAMAFWQTGIARQATGIFIEAPLEECIRRVHARAAKGNGHDVPETIMRTRYAPCLLEYYQHHSTTTFGFPDPLFVLHNDTTEEAFLTQVARLFSYIHEVP